MIVDARAEIRFCLRAGGVLSRRTWPHRNRIHVLVCCPRPSPNRIDGRIDGAPKPSSMLSPSTPHLRFSPAGPSGFAPHQLVLRWDQAHSLVFLLLTPCQAQIHPADDASFADTSSKTPYELQREPGLRTPLKLDKLCHPGILRPTTQSRF